MDKYEKEPRKVLIYTFIFGMLSTFIAMILEIMGNYIIPSKSIAYFLLIVGPAEEFAKFYVLRNYVYKQSSFDEISDGILYASIVALGFATLENVFYILHYGVKIILLRGFISILGHLTFTSFIGIALIKKKLSGKGSALPALLLAAGLHGLFDSFLSTGSIGVIIFVPFFIYIAIVYFKNFKRYTTISKIFKNRDAG
ncbi:PrsW family intramembrane metalloprotease [bacterium]|nr:PrsW family intramembrane metalloprotease [bacterium]